MENKEILLVLGKKLKQYRERNHLTQEQLAEKVGISYPFYANFERSGKGLSINTLVRLADALGVSTDSLLKEETPTEELDNLVAFLQGKPKSFISTANALIHTLYESNCR